MNEELPEDPYPDVSVKVLDVDELAVLLIVDLNGHVTFRNRVTREYARYALNTVLERLKDD